MAALAGVDLDRPRAGGPDTVSVVPRSADHPRSRPTALGRRACLNRLAKKRRLARPRRRHKVQCQSTPRARSVRRLRGGDPVILGQGWTFSTSISRSTGSCPERKYPGTHRCRSGWWSCRTWAGGRASCGKGMRAVDVVMAERRGSWSSPCGKAEAMRLIMTDGLVPDRRSSPCHRTSANRTHQSTSISLIRISSPPCGISLPPAAERDKGQADGRSRSTVLLQS